MGPNMQLIGLVVRSEREVTVNQRPQMTNGSNVVEKKPVYSAKQVNPIKVSFHSPRVQPSCACA
jgi:hypothetical protein